jgi:hypothetical protein
MQSRGRNKGIESPFCKNTNFNKGLHLNSCPRFSRARARVPPRGSANGITDTGPGSLTMHARNKLASWQATGHPLVGPTCNYE